MRLSLLREVWGLVPSLKTPNLSPAQKNYPGSYASLRADEIKLWLTPSAKQRRNPCSGLPAVYPDLSTRHYWPVKKGLCFVCRLKGNSKRSSGNSLRPLVVQNKHLCAYSDLPTPDKGKSGYPLKNILRFYKK